MGKQLLEMYEEAKTIGGFPAQLKLAMLTMISSKKAEILPDSPENIDKFKDALKNLSEEFNSTVNK